VKRFVSKGQTVVVKPNMAWDVRPELGANTNPALVERIVRRCIEAGASKVYVFDHTCDLWKRSYVTSGIEEAARRAGATVVPADQARYYQKAPIAGARILKETLVHELVLQSDVFINVPVLKNHGGAGLTIAMKNLMGIVWDRGEFHSRGLHQCIADLSLLRKPDLNVVDAYRVMTRSGPRGTSERDITIRKAQVLSTDIVAADAAAAKIFGTEPNSVEYIRQGEALKAGDHGPKPAKGRADCPLKGTQPLKKLRLRPLLVWTFLSGFVALFLLRDAGGGGLLEFGAKIQVFPALLRWEITILLFAGMTLPGRAFLLFSPVPPGPFPGSRSRARKAPVDRVS